MTVLVCAATRSELAACRAGIGGGVVAGRGAASFETLLTGVGPVHAAERLAARLASGAKPSLIVSSGLAGVLTRGVDVGSWITAARVSHWERGSLADVAARLREGPAPARACLTISADRILRTTDVGTLVHGLPIAVDMESAALARVAMSRGTPLMVLRLVSDTPDRPLPELLAPFAASMAATGLRSRLTSVLDGVRRSLADPLGVAHIVRDGATWTHGLTVGWARFSPLLVASENLAENADAR